MLYLVLNDIVTFVSLRSPRVEPVDALVHRGVQLSASASTIQVWSTLIHPYS
jgi:hypothetical protein